jgi:hypothetical protein
VGVCEEYDSMGVRERTKRSAVDPSPLLWASSRPFDYAPFVARFGAQRKQGKQFKVERANIQRAESRETECAESPSRSLASGLRSRLPSELPSRLRVNRVNRASSVNRVNPSFLRVKGTGGIGPSRLASKLSVNRVNAKHGEW